MLVLNRKVGEALLLTLPDGREIEILMCRITGAQTGFIGIQAPKDVTIVRKEVAYRTFVQRQSTGRVE